MLAGYRPNEFIGGCWNPTPQDKELGIAFVKVCEVAAEIMRHYGTNCWMNAAVFSTIPIKGRGKREHMGRLPAFYADLDFKNFSDKPPGEAIDDPEALKKVN